MILRVALGMLFCLLFVLPCRADSSAAIAAYGIGVDVTASDAVSAREKAVLTGQRQALAQVVDDIGGADAAAKVASLSDAQITDMLADYQVESEKVSSVRYIGRLTFRFRADAINSYLQQNGITASATAGPPILVLPVLSADGKNLLFDDGNRWLQAWSQHTPPDGLVRLILPKGDATDMGAITADDALAGDNAMIQAAAARYGATEVAVAIATMDQGGLALSVKRYTAAGSIGGFDDKFTGTADATYLAAIDKVATQLQLDWINQNQAAPGGTSGPVSNVEQHLTVEATVANLSQWGEINRRLAAVGAIRHVDVIYLMRDRAELGLDFVGDRDQLVHELGQQALTLQDTADGKTTLSLADGPQP
jgi:hypothetical protein